MQSRRPTAIAVAREIDDGDDPLYALIGADSPVPDVSLLGDTWTPFMPARGAVQQIGDPVMLETEHEAGDYYEPAAEPDTLDSSGTPQIYRAGAGSISVMPHSVPAFGGGWGSHLAIAFAKLLGSGSLVRDAITTRTLAATGSNDANEWTCAAVPADMHVGQVVTRTVGGRKHASMVSGLAEGVVRQLLPLGAALAEADVVELCQTFDFGKPRSDLELGPSVALRMDGAGWREYCFGGRWSELSVTMNQRAVQADFAMNFDLIIDASGDAAVVAGTNTDAIPYEPPGRRILTWAGTRPQMSSGSSFDRTDPTLTAPIMLGGERLYVDEVSIKITNTLGRRGDFDGLGPGPHEVDGMSAEISLLLSQEVDDLAALQRRLWDAYRNALALALPMGPVGQHGGGWVVPAATLKTDVRRFDFGKDFYRIPLMFGLGPNISEDSGGTAPLKLGLA